MAGSTNLIRVNPNFTGAETDSQYAQDSIVLNGGIPNTRLPAAFFNKFVGQMTTTVVALVTALVAKGYTFLDTDFQGQVNAFSQVLTNNDVLPKLLGIAYSPSLVFDGSKATGWQVQLFGNCSVSLANAKVGQEYVVIFQQGGNGGASVNWGSGFIGGTQVDTDANSFSTFKFLTTLDGIARADAPQVNG